MSDVQAGPRQPEADAGAHHSNPDLPEAFAGASTILWAWTYHEGLLGDNGRVAAGIKAMKQALQFNGFGEGILVAVPAFGDAAANRTEDFQKREGLQADGVIGRVTARHLFRNYAIMSEDKHLVPDNLVGRLKTWESQNDPVCRGISGDEGVAQISPPNHPDVTLAQMWSPAWALDFAGGYLHGAHILMNDWDGAVAAYNVGGGTAQRWVKAGKPDSGGPELGTDQNGNVIYAWERCAFYVASVRASSF